MGITLLGLGLIPLSLIWALNPLRLLQLALVASVFEAAAALVIGGSFGLQPGMVPGLLFIAYILLQYALGMRYPGERVAFWVMAPLLAFLAYALLSITMLPDLFAGKIFVWPQKVDPLSPGAVPLQFTFGNVTQSLYLAIDMMFATCVAVFLTRHRIEYPRIIAAYLTGGYVVVGLVFWQFANRLAGVPFPDDLLYSNPGWAIVTQAIGTVPRLQGPFSEPAGLAFYLSGLAFCCLWLSIRGYQMMRPNLLLAFSITCTLLSTSTTGIVVLCVGLPLVLAAALAGGAPGALGRIGKTMGRLLLGGTIVLAPVFILKPQLIEPIQLVVEGTLSKGDSDSYAERSAADADAFKAMFESYGLGVGWGSLRSSSLIPGLAGNSGVFGLAMIVWFAARIYRFGKRFGARSKNHQGKMVVDGFSAALCGQLAGAIVSAPNIVNLAFFLQLGCIAGVLSRMAVEQEAQASGSRAKGPNFAHLDTPATSA